MYFGNLERQMALIARIQHPYIVEFKEAWVEKVRNIIYLFIFSLNGILVLVVMFLKLSLFFRLNFESWNL